MSKNNIYLKQIDLINKEIIDIKKAILDDSNDISKILDSYEIDKSCYYFINNNDKDYFELLIKLLKAYYKDTQNINESCDMIKTINKDKKGFQSFMTFVNNKLNEVIININESTDEEDDDSDDETLDEIDEGLGDYIIKPTDVIKLRYNQEVGRIGNKKNNFKSGVHWQITGAGKSILIMMTINDHYKLDFELDPKKNNGKLYIITCPRIEVLNKMFFELNDSGEYVINSDNKKFWKDNEIINLDDFKIFDRVNYTASKKLQLSKDKPNLLIVNTDMFKILDSKNYIDYNKVTFVLFDECHGVSAQKFYDLLYKIKFTHKKHIIGFSATPVRDRAEDKVKKIFSTSTKEQDKHKLNIISDYDMFHAIHDGFVLPPSYTIVEIKKTCNKKIGKTNKDITEKILRDRIKLLPYKKMVCWCRNISNMKEWYRFFKDRFPELKLYCSTSKYGEHDKTGFNTDFDKFCDSESNSILLCVNRCREGSDIKNLDMGVYLDYVKKRGILVSIQTVGRILRPDKKKLKKNGYIIDTFVNDGKIEIELLTAQKIISYYEKVLGLTVDGVDGEYDELMKNYQKIKELFSNTSYDESSKNIEIRIDDNNNMNIKLELITKNFDWLKFKTRLDSIIDRNFDVNKDKKLKLEYSMLKEKVQKIKFDGKDDYKSYAKNNSIEIQPEIKYINHGWVNYYDFLGININNFPETLDELKKILKIKKITNKKIYEEKAEKYELPLMPEELYKNFTSIYNTLNAEPLRR